MRQHNLLKARGIPQPWHLFRHTALGSQLCRPESSRFYSRQIFPLAGNKSPGMTVHIDEKA
jgi:hypothetical protein